MKNGIITNAVDWRNRKLQGSVKFQGLPLSIENERGSYRQGTDEHGNVWRTPFLSLKYGYIRGTDAIDGDALDVYVGSNDHSDKVFVVNQNDPYTGKFDELKCMLGFNSGIEARVAYINQYDRPDYFGSMVEMDMATFKQKVRNGLGKRRLRKSLDFEATTNRLMVNSELSAYLSHGKSLFIKSNSDIPIKASTTFSMKFDTTAFERSPDSTLINIEVLGDLSNRQTILFKSDTLIDIPFGPLTKVVKAGMFRGGHDLKITDDVVQPVTIDVVNNFTNQKRSSEMLGHDMPVFQKLYTIYMNKAISYSGFGIGTCPTSGVASTHRNPPAMHSIPPLVSDVKNLQKAKYLRRWRGKDDKWHYEYARQRGATRHSKKAKVNASQFQYIVPDNFDAAQWAAGQDFPDVSLQTVLKDVNDPGVLKKIQATEEKLRGVNPTVSLHRLFGEGAGSIYDQTRTKKHDHIIRTILSAENVTKAKPAEGEQPSFIMLGGRGGSGKSWFKGQVYDPNRTIVLDSDEIKGMLTEYKGWNAFEVHEESSDILDKLIAITQYWGLNVVVDATLKSTRSAVSKAEEFKRLGYSLECHYMHLPRAQAAKRAVSRFMSESGRYVPVNVVLSNTTNEQTFEELKGYTDSWSFYDNSGNPPPKLISKSGSGKFATLHKGLHSAVVDDPYRKNFDYYDFRDPCDPEDYAPDVKEFIAMGNLQKSKYTRRWKGKDGKWNYEYGKSSKAKKKVARSGSVLNMTLEEFKRQPPSGFEYTKHDDYIAMRPQGKGITILSDRFWDHDTANQRRILLHELGHDLINTLDYNKYYSNVLKEFRISSNKFDNPFGERADSAEEVIANTYMALNTNLWRGYEEPEGKYVKLLMAVANVALERGLPISQEFKDIWLNKSLEKSKYTKKFWKNGQWHYTYDKNGSRRPKRMPSHAVHKNLGGTTGGAFLISLPNGERKVMKQSISPKHITEEYTANRVYKILGVPVPNVSLYSTDKGVAQVADFVEGTSMGDLEPEERYDAIESLKRGFVADALLGNWDVLGMDEDNILWDGSKAWRIDNGGAMRYRAQGAAKGESFAGTVGELETMRNPEKGAGRRAYSGVTEAEIMNQINNVVAHKQAILQAVADPKLRGIMEARINSLTEMAKSMNWLPDLTLLKSDSGMWHLYEHGMLTQFYWFHDLEKAIKTKSYYSPEEVKARGMRWVTIRGARVLLQGTADGGYVVVGGAGGKLNHLKIDKILSKEDYSKKRGKVEAKRTEDLRKLSKEEMAEHVAQRRKEVKAKKVVRAAYTEKVTEVLGITQEEIRSEISAKQMDELANKARIMVEGRASAKTLNQKVIDKEIEKQTEKELNKAVHKKIKDTERQALETLMKDYMPDDPNAKPELKKLLDHDKAVEILAARKEFRKQIKAIGKDAADIPTDLKVGDVFAGATDKDVKAIEQEVRDQIETQKNIRLYDTMNAQSLSIRKHVDEGAISALNGLIGDLYGSGATFSSGTVAQLGLEAVVRSVAIKIQKDGRGGAVKKVLEEYAGNEREKVVTTALTESEKRFKNAEQLRSLARDTDDAEAILSMASANGHALNQLTAGQRALGTAVGSLRAVAHLTAALDDPPADVVQIDIGKDLTRARKKAQKAGLTKGSYSIKTLKEGRAKRLVLELKKDNIDTFFQRNEEMRKSENIVDRIKRHEMNDGYKPEGIQDSIAFDDAQEAGLRFFKEQNNVILDFEAGLGKTGMAYGAMMEAIQNKGAKKILVVTPAKIRGDFKRQSKTFLTKDMQKMVLSSTENTTKADRHARHNAESGIHIVSQDSLRNDAAAIKAAGYDMIVVDEIHEMTAGTGQAGRYKALQTLSDIPMKIVMSGTNIKNKKNELYRKINFVNPEHTLGSMAEFDKRYKGLNQGTGMFADAANEAFRKEMSPYMYTQKNALDIENHTTTKRVPMTSSQRKAYAASERQYREDRANKVPGASAKRDSRNYKIITDGKDINNGKLNELVNTMNTKHAGEKAVIHVSRPGVPVLEAMKTASARLVKEYGEDSVGMIHGESSPGAVTELKRRFNDPDDSLRFIVGTKSLESGHNLQHGGSVTFHLDIPDSYSAFEQRNARVFRKKQDQDTSTYVLSGTNPYDMRGEDIMETKRKEQGILGNPREIESMDDSGFLGLLNKYETEVQGATA